MKVSEILKTQRSDLVTIEPDKTVSDAVHLLCQHRIGALLVMQEDQLEGIITERDILLLLNEEGGDKLERKVSAVMTRNLICAIADDTVDAIMNIMTRNRIRHLPIIKDNQLHGMLSVGDVIRSLHESSADENRYLRDYILQG